MSMHKVPLSKLEEEGLKVHGLGIGTPSQLSDVFRQGMVWALSQQEDSSAIPPAQDDDDYMPEGIAEAIMHGEVMDIPSMAATALREQLTAPAQDERGLSHED